MSVTDEQFPVASRAECLLAVESLSANDWSVLRTFAALEAFAERGLLYNTAPQDLIHEAVVRTLDGRREWRPQKVDFMMHMKGCIRSIANQYLKQAQRQSPRGIEGIEAANLILENNEENIFRKSILQSTYLMLKIGADKNIFNLLCEGHSASEIKGILEIDTITYNNARKRITRALYDCMGSALEKPAQMKVRRTRPITSLLPPRPLPSVLMLDHNPAPETISQWARNLVTGLCEEPFQAGELDREDFESSFYAESGVRPNADPVALRDEIRTRAREYADKLRSTPPTASKL